MAKVDQLVDGFARGDAVSDEARALRRRLRELGHSSEIFALAERIAPDSEAEARPCEALVDRRPDAMILHYSIASPVVYRWIQGEFRRLLRYHNITPAEWFQPYERAVAEQLRHSRELLPQVLAAAHAVAAVSRFNAMDLASLGRLNVRVFPLLSAGPIADEPDARLEAALDASWSHFLHVGRVAPNKCIEELIGAFALYQRAWNPCARLLIAGSLHSCPRYSAFLRAWIAELDLDNVWLMGFVSGAELRACYDRATVVVSASRHEGFCAPLLTALHHGVPVLARRVGGIPEAVGDAALLYDEADPAELAALFRIVEVDNDLRGKLIQAGRDHCAELNARDPLAELREWLAEAGIE